MAIVADAQLGTTYLIGDQTSITLTTAAAVASGGFIVLGVGASAWHTGVALGTVTGGGLTWTVDKQQIPGLGSDNGYGIISAQAPAGLAASTVITIPWTGPDPVQYPICGGASFTGVKTSSPVDGTPVGVNGTATSWTTGNVAISAGSLLAGGVHFDSGDSYVATAGAKVWERNNSGGPSNVGVYRVESSAGSYPLSGTWTGSTLYAGAAVAYLAAATTPDTGLAWIKA